MTVTLAWLPARLVERTEQTTTARTLVFAVPGWPGHLPGQHVDVRLTADDGYQAVRSYSLAAPADDDRLELGVQPVPDGEVSPYLADQLPPDAEVEMRGPLGNWFVWQPEQTQSALLVAGGSGVVPLVAMIRAHHAAGSPSLFQLIYSVRTPEDIWYREDLTSAGPHFHSQIIHTRRTPQGDSTRAPGRITTADLEQATTRLEPQSPVYVCGPTGFVETASDLLTELLDKQGIDPTTIRTERFG
ncbi:ferredoxin reductase [Streptomyces sp. NPDC098781]|uniref:ferredoxin reductase n=1 Tax=Streptomyces sp. NPDC098781 TaxID=3366097 RepID=UPI0037FDB883